MIDDFFKLFSSRLLKIFIYVLFLLQLTKNFDELHSSQDTLPRRVKRSEEESINTILSQKNITRKLVDDKRKIEPLLQDLFALNGFIAQDLKSAVTITQNRWIAVRQGMNGIERCDIIDKPDYLMIKDKVLKVIRELNIFENQKPLLQKYDYAICLGAFLQPSRERLALLIDAWQQGVRFDWLVFLGCDRKLRNQLDDIESYAFLCDQNSTSLTLKKNWSLSLIDEIPYSTEYDMLKIIWDQAEVPLDMQQHLCNHIVFINAQAKNSSSRASTGDTYLEWLETCCPKPGLVLAASSPFVWAYQHLVGLNSLGQDYPLDTIANSATAESITVTILFDTIAKCLYEIKKKMDSLPSRE